MRKPTTSDSEHDDRHDDGTEGSVWVRRLLISVAVIAVLLAGAGIAAKMIFTPEKLTSLVVPRLQDAAGRDVQVSTVELDLLPRPAVRLEDVSLAAAPGFGPEPALTGEAVELQIALLPLLRGRVTLSRLHLVAPTVRYLVAPDGRHSFSGLGGGPAEDSPAAADAEDAVALPVNHFAVERGTVLYDDRERDRGARFRTSGSFTASLSDDAPTTISGEGDLRIASLRALLPELGDDSLSVESFRLWYEGVLVPAADSLDLRRVGLEVDRVQLTGRGAVGWKGEAPRASLRIETGETDIEVLRRWAPRLDEDDLQPRGTVQLTMTVDGPLDADALAELEGEVRIRRVALAYSGRDEFVSDVDGTVSFTGRSARIVSLEGRLLGRDIRVEGTIADFDSLLTDLKMEGSGDLERLGEVLPEDLPGGPAAAVSARGDARFSLRVRGPLRGEATPDVTGEARISGLGVDWAGVPDVIDGVGATISFAGDSVRVSPFDGSVLGGRVRGDVQLTRGEPPRVEGQIAGEIDLERVSTVQARRAELAADPDADATPSLSGTADVDLAFRGTLDGLSGLTLRGPVRLSEISYETPSLSAPLRIRSGAVRLTGSGVQTEELGVRVGETELTFTAHARDVLPLSRLERARRGEGTRPTLEFRVASDRVPLDRLFPDRPDDRTGPTYSQVLKAHLGGQQLDGRRPEEIAVDRYPLPGLPELDARGEVRVGELVNPPTRMEELTFRLDLEEGALRVYEVGARLYDGRLTGEVSAEVGRDDRRSAVRFDMALEGSDAAAFMDRWTTLDDALTGTMDLSIAGRTMFDRTLLPVIEQTDAEGRMTVRDGSVEGMLPMRGVVRAVGMSSDSIARFDSLGGPFRVRNGRLELLGWRLVSRSGANGRMAGTMAFAGQLGLDMTLSVPLSMLRGSPLTKLVGGGPGDRLGPLLGKAAGEDEMIDIPLSVGGTMSDPTVTVDERAFAAGLRSLLEDAGGARGLLQRLLGGDRNDEKDGGGGVLDRLLEGKEDSTGAGSGGGGR